MTTPTITNSMAVPTSSTPSFDRGLTDEELARVIARVRSADQEHGIVAALAVFDVAAADRLASGPDALAALDPTAVAAIPLHQWREIQAVIDSEAVRRDHGTASAVLADWVRFGPRISAP